MNSESIRLSATKCKIGSLINSVQITELRRLLNIKRSKTASVRVQSICVSPHWATRVSNSELCLSPAEQDLVSINYLKIYYFLEAVWNTSEGGDRVRLDQCHHSWRRSRQTLLLTITGNLYTCCFLIYFKQEGSEQRSVNQISASGVMIGVSWANWSWSCFQHDPTSGLTWDETLINFCFDKFARININWSSNNLR